MPTMIELLLQPQRPVQAGRRQLHGLACALFERASDSHDGQEKPFAVWPLQPGPSGAGQMQLRAAWLPDAPLPKGVQDVAQVRLGAQPLSICRIEYHVATRAKLAGMPTLREVTLAFRSPVFFSRNGTDDLTPDPRLILGSYRRRWNASLNPGHVLAIGDDDWRDTHRWVRLTRYDLATQAIDGGRGRDRSGFTGTGTLYVDLAAPRAAVSVFSTMARFAPFCGTGAQTNRPQTLRSQA